MSNLPSDTSHVSNVKFENWPFKPFIFKSLQVLSFKKPTLCQAKVIPFLLKNQNLLCQSKTGTGKTHAYLLPILNQIDPQLNQIQAIVFCPTKELARQIIAVIKIFQKFNPQLKSALLISGIDIKRQSKKYQNMLPHIVAATPKRLKSLYLDFKLPITTCRFVIIDECDMMMELNFLQDLYLLLNKMNEKVCCSVFSATIPEKLLIVFKKLLKNPQHIFLNSRKQLTNPNIQHILIPTRFQNRINILQDLVNAINPYLCLIFANTKKTIDQIFENLKKHKIKVCKIYSGLSDRQRKQILKRIRNLQYQFIVCSDIMARGIDIEGISDIISFELPTDLYYYIHRSGRTGRHEFTGRSYLLYDTEDNKKIN